MKQERWRWVDGYEGLYMVSDYGRIMSAPKPTRTGWSIMRGSVGSGGYMFVNLRKNGVQKRKSIHRLVASTFVPNPNDKPEVNHIDGCKTNNCVSNLEWVTRSENQKHAHANIPRKPYKGTPRPTLRKLNERQVVEIRTKAETQASYAMRFGVSKHAIQAIQSGETYKEVN